MAIFDFRLLNLYLHISRSTREGRSAFFFSVIATEAGKVFYEIDTLPVVVDVGRLKNYILWNRVRILVKHLEKSLRILEPATPDSFRAEVA